MRKLQLNWELARLAGPLLRAVVTGNLEEFDRVQSRVEAIHRDLGHTHDSGGSSNPSA